LKKRTKKLLAVAILALGACAMQQAANPAALQDAYLVAHGMAASYVERPDANPDVVQQLVVLDARAAQAMRSQDNAATAMAVAALTTLAARL